MEETLNRLATTQSTDEAGVFKRSQAGMLPEREAELLQAWRQRQ